MIQAAVYLLADKQHTVQRGHPWIFPKAIARQQGVVTGELVDIFSENDEWLGVGVYNEHSLYRVRVLALAFESFNIRSLEEIVKHRIQQAIHIRHALNLPNHDTNAYRLFNSEGDGLSGLTIDRFDNIIVVASSAYWVQKECVLIMRALEESLPMCEIIWLPQYKTLAQDGWHDAKESHDTRHIYVKEANVYYHVDFSHSQKTGLFLDQRDNHMRIATLARGKRVLDLYTYTGGFALHAAKMGASWVTAIDSSSHAIALAEQNATYNQLQSIEFIEADARDYLVKASEYDIVILDPPKLVPSRKHRDKAKNYYRYLHREVFKAMRSGSLLMTCNCSSAISQEEFACLVELQALAVGKRVRIHGIYGPAACHPMIANFKEGQYLTAILLSVV